MDTNHHTHSNLKDYTLWFDGDIVTDDLNTLMALMSKGVKVQQLFLKEITPEVNQYNLIASPCDRITTKDKMEDLSSDWIIPRSYETLDVKDYVVDKLYDKSEMELYTNSDIKLRLKRIIMELELFHARGLFPVLRAIIYVINTLEANNIVWGVGRGSSVSSYLLYLIGTHDVDSFKYNLDIVDFIS